MIQELLKDLLRVEQDMSAIVNEANEFAKQMRADAEAEAEKLPVQARLAAEREAETRIAEAERMAGETRDSILEEARKEARALDESAERNIEQAVDLVVARVLQTEER